VSEVSVVIIVEGPAAAPAATIIIRVGYFC
jgi:hypothetical protein